MNIESLVDPNIDRVMVCVERHGYWFAHWCLREQGIGRWKALQMLWVANKRSQHEYWRYND
jgi:hypothetical protein